jgi:hypothetical protein
MRRWRILTLPRCVPRQKLKLDGLRSKTSKSHVTGNGKLSSRAISWVSENDLIEEGLNLSKQNPGLDSSSVLSQILWPGGPAADIDAVNTLCTHHPDFECVLLQSICGEDGDLITDKAYERRLYQCDEDAKTVFPRKMEVRESSQMGRHIVRNWLYPSVCKTVPKSLALSIPVR